MTDQEKLYETLGELLFVIAKADGVIQDEERGALTKLLKNHSWARDIEWSFNYEESKQPSIEELYDKVIIACHRIGPSLIYTEFISSMNAIADASSGVDEDEDGIIKSFSADLIKRFSEDIDILQA